MVTRGTTAINRLRRADRWLTGSPRVRAALHSTEAPLVVDLGFGRVPVTTLELAARLRGVAPAVRVVGLEIDPERVAAAHDAAEARLDALKKQVEAQRSAVALARSNAAASSA